MSIKPIDLEIREELMIYIANNLPFIAKGSFLTSQYHKNPQARLLNGGDIDLIYDNTNGAIKTPKICDYDSYHGFLRQIEKLLKNELIDIFYKLEEIMTKKLNLTKRPSFILEFEKLGYDRIFKDGGEIYLFLVNYATDGDFTTVGLEITTDNIDYIEIDIAIDMPVHFQPETILYKTITGKEVTLKNTTPLIYQTAWKIHQILARPRLKDLDDVIRFLPHIDFKDKHNFEIFFNEIISECKLTDSKTCKQLIETFKKLFVKDNLTQKMIVGKIVNDWYMTRYYKYYTDLYGMDYKIDRLEDTQKLKNKVCSDFLNALQSKIDCDAALEYIQRHYDDI